MNTPLYSAIRYLGWSHILWIMNDSDWKKRLLRYASGQWFANNLEAMRYYNLVRRSEKKNIIQTAQQAKSADGLDKLNHPGNYGRSL